MVLMSVTAVYEKSSTDGDILVVIDPIDEIVGLFEVVTGLAVNGSAGTEDVADGDEEVVAIGVDELEEDVGVLDVLHGADECDRFL